MKYIVGLKYTNPAHEHVSLRRRVESRNAVIEASSEEEAILRASRQQRALGFSVQEAGILNPELNESVQVNESNEEVESVDEAKKQLKPSYWRAEWRLGTQSEVDKNNKKIFDKLAKTDPVKAAAFHDNLMKLKKKDMKEEAVTEAKGEPPAEFMPSDTKLPRIKVPAKPKPGVRKRGPVGSFNKKGFWNPGVREEVEQIDERNKENADRRKMMDAERGNKFKSQGHYTPAPTLNQKDDQAHSKMVGRTIRKMSREEVEQIDEVKQGKEYTKQQLVNKMKAGNWETSYDIKPGKHVEMKHHSGKKVSVYVKEEVDSVNEAEREAGYKMPDAVRKAQAKFDVQARAQQVKKVQAGTLAAQRQRELTKKTDEAADPGKTRVVNKKVKTEKAAQVMINKAKGMRNKINMNPELTTDGQKKV